MKEAAPSYPDAEKHLQEKCGIVALYHPTSNISEQVTIALTAADGVQHRGQLGGGIAIHTEEGLRTHFGKGLLKDVFTPGIQAELGTEGKGKWALVHARYGTFGGYDDRNLQPTITRSPDGSTNVVIHNGQFVATEALRARIPESLPDDISDTYMFARILAQEEGNSPEDRLLNALGKVNGAFSMAIGINDSLYLARDTFGIRPLMLGKLHNGWIAASETFALDKIGVRTEREIKRGEVVRINEDGLTVIQEGLDGQGNFCDFEWDYFSRPNSLQPTHELPDDSDHPERWLSNLVAREQCGRILAQEKPIAHADFVVGVPDSGVAFATGYAAGMNLPYRQVILRDHYNENSSKRLFLGDDDMQGISQRVIGKDGKLSLVDDRRIWEDAVVVFGDDSTVRSSVAKELTKAIFAAGAKEVHEVVGFPPVMHPCHLGVSMRTRAELIAAIHHGDPVKIAEAIGLTSINYISHEGFVRSRKYSGITIPEDPKDIFLANGGCGGCLTGKYPISKEGDIYELK